MRSISAVRFTSVVFVACLALGPLGRALAESPAKLTGPTPLHSVKAEFPAEALAERKEGSVTILATLGKDGVVKAAEVSEGSGDARLDKAALDAALQWRFSPALQDGVPIEAQIRIPFHFHLVEHGPDEHVKQPPKQDPVPDATPDPTPTPTPTPTPAPTPTPTPDANESAEATSQGAKPSYQSNVRGSKDPPSRGASDYHVDVEKLSVVPRGNASDFLKLAPGILLTNAGGEGHAEQVFLRGFDAREAQDIEFSVDGVPINEVGNLHGSGYADTHFIIPELVQSLRIVEGPFDPRQGNFAVAGSADYHLGLTKRGLTAQFTVGNFGSYRLLLSWAPPSGSPGTFVAAELYQTAGYGQNRDGRRATVIGQYEGRHGSIDLRVTATAYLSSFHTAGVLRDDDYRAGRVGFYDTYDTRQGEDASRYSLAMELGSRVGRVALRNTLFGIARPLRIRENFTGFLLDVQQPLQQPHGQRGDLIDMSMMEWTVGSKGYAKLSGRLLNQVQELELGYFARGDFVSAQQQRIEASTGHPYHTDTNLESKMGNIGIYADANVRFLKWLALRGGARGDVFAYDVNDLCAVQSVSKPSPSNPPGDASCLSQQAFGAYREPNQRASTVSAAFLPRGSLILGPLWGFGASVSAGKGVRSIDPQYITQDAGTPYASIVAYEGGLNFARRFRDTIDLRVSSVVFYTHVDRDLIFSETAGRSVLATGTSRIGSASTARFTGPWWDLAANLTYVKATFDDTGLLVPYVPDLVFRADGMVGGDLPWWKKKLRDHAIRASLGAAVTYVGPRPLPFGARSDTIATLDASATVGWWFVDLSFSAQNLTDTQYRLGEYNFASDFRSTTYPSLVPQRHFATGAPRTMFFTIALNYGGNR